MKLMTLAVLCVALGINQNKDCDTLENCQEALKASPRGSLIHFRMGEIYFSAKQQRERSQSISRDVKWRPRSKVDGGLAHIDLGKIFDVTNQRDRALNEYRLALRTKDNTRGALDEEAKHI